MELLQLECLDQALVLTGSMAGWQQLFLGGVLVSQLAATADSEARRVHEFELTQTSTAQPSPVLRCRLESTVIWQPFSLDYQFFINGELTAQGQRNTKDIERQVPTQAAQASKPFSFIGVGALLMKLLKSAKVVKLVLAGASLAAYSWLFSFQFAVALITCLVFHEYGHIRAMRYFGMKTKGIYLIPFFGGAAVTEDKINTRWQNVVISMMGPCFGLLMSLACMVAFWVSGSMIFAGLAVFNAMLNLFNLLPVLPLDGGHVLKSISFSMNNMLGIVLCIIGALIGVALCYTFHLSLLGFFLLIGCLDIFMEWRTRHNSHLLPLDRYGQVFSAVWYCALVASLIGIIWYFSGHGDDVLSMPMRILKS